MKTKDLQIDTLQSVGVTQIIPKEWEDWIWTGLSDNAPFSWGDNNHSLVDAFSFGDHLDSVLDYHQDDYEDVIKEYRQAVFDTINYLEANKIYIDLEE
jgi:hypothetical protein